MTDTIEKIRARHKACDHIIEWPDFDFFEAYNDRATLLRALDAALPALQFYADPANYVGHYDPSASVYIETSALDTDRGERARVVLKGLGT